LRRVLNSGSGLVREWLVQFVVWACIFADNSAEPKLNKFQKINFSEKTTTRIQE
jgi:hypothetical protein